MPREQVPEHWKCPDGPYRQAPPEYGGQWWLVNPFTGVEPWRREPPPAERLPPGFERIFGPRPQSKDFPIRKAWILALTEWSTDLRTFVKAGDPPGYSTAQLGLADSLFQRWSMGAPAYYENRYGWRVRWPDSRVPDFELPAHMAVEFSHIAIALYQDEMRQDGLTPDKEHPFLDTLSSNGGGGVVFCTPR